MSIKNLLFLLASIVLIAVNYFIFNEMKNIKQEKIKQTIVEVKEIKNIATSKHISPKNENYKNDINNSINENEDEKDTIKNEPSKPLLAIIIDDVSFPWHLRLINTVNLPLNMSFLPPTSRHPQSHLLASDYNKYMVHLPLEAKRYYASEIGTLKINSTYENIENKIKLIRSLFPKAKYINNHTGSKFTSDFNAMRNLSLALKKYNFTFLDSKTIASSKANVVFGDKVLSRDIFLDNIDDVSYIKKQITKSIKKSIKKGYAIAIGHPRKNTLQAIKEMEEYISKYTKVVYIDDLNYELSNK